MIRNGMRNRIEVENKIIMGVIRGIEPRLVWD
jgi:hypothetical protein